MLSAVHEHTGGAQQQRSLWHDQKHPGIMAIQAMMPLDPHDLAEASKEVITKAVDHLQRQERSVVSFPKHPEGDANLFTHMQVVGLVLSGTVDFHISQGVAEAEGPGTAKH